MITFLTSPKPFTGIASIQQTKAIRNWQGLGDNVEVILYGDSPRTAAACRELGIRHVPDIKATEQGIPYFEAIAAHAAEHASYDIQVYLNCDILLTSHILKAIKRIPFADFLMIGQRIDLKEGVEVDAAGIGNPEQLMMLADAGLISLHTPGGSDYFAFRRGMWTDLPPVVIGRGGYDNALIAYCLQRHIPVIDSTLTVPALHQFHDYGHAAGGADEVFKGDDAKRNLAFVPLDAIPVLEDSCYLLRGNELSQIRCRGDLLRFLFMKYRYRNVPLLPGILRNLWRLQTKIGLRHWWDPTLQEVLASYQELPQEKLS